MPESNSIAVDKEKQIWEQQPFNFHQQMKILLILADGTPFRNTGSNYPNLLDVKEASRLTGWEKRHTQFLINIGIRKEFITYGDDRFYITQKGLEWLSSGENPLQSFEAPLSQGLENDTSEFEPDLFCDLSDVIVKLLSFDGLKNEEGITVEQLDQKLIKSIREQFEKTLPVEDIPYFIELSVLEICYWMGWVDALYVEGALKRVRINERGQSWRDIKSPSKTTSEELPIILQPDGVLLLPLEAPMRYFRRVNPFTLITNVDNMIQYTIDRSSLTKALNNGWDTGAFYEFLDERVGDIPMTVENLFEDSVTEPEQVDVQKVNYLLEFENPTTTTEAVRALGNYRPLKLDETRIVLRSSTSEETIMKNLSHAGIRLKTSGDDSRRKSVVKEI